MKNVILIILFIFFLIVALLYHGVFRNNNDPFEVAKYFFACLQNREWFLTYQIYDRSNFHEGRMRGFYADYKLGLVDKIELKIKKIEDKSAIIEAGLVYKDRQRLYLSVDLEKTNKGWLIRNFKELKNASF